MNNTKNTLLITIIAATLIMGTSVIPMQSYAESSKDQNKKTGDFKPSISASQHQDQDNVCYRGNETCTQANEGQLAIGKDNELTGFNDQSINVQQSTTTATPTPTPTPIPLTCDECFRSHLSQAEIDNVLFEFESPTLGLLCLHLPDLSESIVIHELLDAKIDPTTIDEIVKCLKAAGIVFLPELQ